MDNKLIAKPARSAFRNIVHARFHCPFESQLVRA